MFIYSVDPTPPPVFNLCLFSHPNPPSKASSLKLSRPRRDYLLIGGLRGAKGKFKRGETSIGWEGGKKNKILDTACQVKVNFLIWLRLYRA